MDVKSKIEDAFKIFSPQGVLLFTFIVGAIAGSFLYRREFHLPERKQLQHESAMIQQRNNHLRARLNCVEKKIQCDFKVNPDYLK